MQPAVVAPRVDIPPTLIVVQPESSNILYLSRSKNIGHILDMTPHRFLGHQAKMHISSLLIIQIGS